jgi:hypothetical protein
MSRKYSTKPEEIDRKGHYNTYEEYAKNLRTWFVAYGIGGPVLLLTQKSISERIAQSGQARYIVYGFLLGVLFQIMLSFINKWNNWTIYAFSESEDLMKKWCFKLAEIISEQSWIDKLLDVLTIIAFAYSTIKVLLLFT